MIRKLNKHISHILHTRSSPIVNHSFMYTVMTCIKVLQFSCRIVPCKSNISHKIPIALHVLHNAHLERISFAFTSGNMVIIIPFIKKVDGFG